MSLAEETVQLLNKPSKLIREVRQQQVTMAEIVAKGLENKQNVIVEAGTGVGKSFAYLIPAILFCDQTPTKKRVVVSTATKGLQSQLIEKDLPHLVKNMGADVTYAIVKSRRNYLCPLAVSNSKKHFNEAQFFDLGKHVDQVLANHTVGEIWQAHLPAHLIDLVSAENCVGPRCKYYRECEYAVNRQRIQSAQILVTNHYALARLIVHAFGMGSLGEFHGLIIDEAHKAVNAFRSSLSETLRRTTLERVFSNIEAQGIPSKYADQWQGVLPHRAELLESYYTLFSMLPKLQKGQFKELSPQTVLKGQQFVYEALKFDRTINTLAKLFNPDILLEDVLHMVDQLPTEFFLELHKAENTEKRLKAIGQALVTAARLISGETDLSLNLCYVTHEIRDVALVVKPFDTQFIFEPVLESEIPIIMTSATLATGTDFKMALGEFGLACEEQYQGILGSPYDIDGRTVLYLPFPEEFPEPPAFNAPAKAQAEYNKGLCDQVTKLVKAVDGNVFCLFTSKFALGQAQKQLKKSLRGFTLLAQSEGIPASHVLEQYKEAVELNQKPVLLGLKSFWEGVSLDGDALRAVIITKLPFPPIGTPEFAAYGKKYGSEAFMNYSMPEVTKDLKQGMGRLIRTKDDYGLLAILDSRTLVKNYRRILRHALPSRRSRDIDVVIEAYKQMQKNFDN